MFVLHVNGEARSVDVPADMSLLWAATGKIVAPQTVPAGAA